ncbi:MAG: hypothetical protein ACREIA_21855 [Opitutaceae bacterium]
MTQTIAEHRMYLPLAALLVGIAGLAAANLGAACLLTGSTTEAIAEYRAALSLDPDCTPAQKGLEQALARGSH